VIGGAVGTLVGAALILLEKKSPAPARYQPAIHPVRSAKPQGNA